MSQLNYTVIHHETRKLLDLTMNEYAVADLIYHLQNNPKSSIPDWCYASRETLGSMLGLSEKSIRVIIQKLESKYLVRKNGLTRHVQTTEKWYEEAVLTQAEESSGTRKKVPAGAEESSVEGAEESSGNNYIYNNNNKSNVPVEEKKQEIQDEGVLLKNGPAAHSKKLSATEIEKAYSKIGYLTALSDADVQWFTDKFPVTSQEVRTQCERAYYWLKGKGKTQKDYRAFMRNWIERTVENRGQSRGGPRIEQ